MVTAAESMFILSRSHMTDHVTKELTTHWNSKPFHPPALRKDWE